MCFAACLTFSPASRMNTKHAMRCLRACRPLSRDIIQLHFSYGCSDAKVHAGVFCIHKHQAGHRTSPANKLLHLRGTRKCEERLQYHHC